MNIYTTIIPTYLYIKRHSVTKLKYFGKTSLDDPIKYLGSGTYWTKHINKHGKQFVDTIWLSDLYTDISISEHALHFSHENDIVKSDEWANLKLENGLDGGAYLPSQPTVERICYCGNIFQSKHSSKKATCGYSCSNTITANKRIPIALNNNIYIFKNLFNNEIIHSTIFDFKKYSFLSAANINHLVHGNHKIIKYWTIFDTVANKFRNEIPNKSPPKPLTKICSHCNKEISYANYVRWHGDNCKMISFIMN